MADRANRRPLASRDTGWARSMTRWLAATSVTPNQISMASIAAAAVAGACFWLAGSGGRRRACNTSCRRCGVLPAPAPVQSLRRHGRHRGGQAGSRRRVLERVPRPGGRHADPGRRGLWRGRAGARLGRGGLCRADGLHPRARPGLWTGRRLLRTRWPSSTAWR